MWRCLAWSGWGGRSGGSSGAAPNGHRHCEERSDEAIHLAAQRKNGLLRSAHNDGGHTFTISRLDLPEACSRISLTLQSEGAGNAGCTLHPRSRVQ
jgi:hypothetical protein